MLREPRRRNRAARHLLGWDPDVFLDHEWAVGPTRVLGTAAPAAGTGLCVGGPHSGPPAPRHTVLSWKTSPSHSVTVSGRCGNLCRCGPRGGSLGLSGKRSDCGLKGDREARPRPRGLRGTCPRKKPRGREPAPSSPPLGRRSEGPGLSPRSGTRCSLQLRTL